MDFINRLKQMEDSVYFQGHRDDAEVLMQLINIFEANKITSLTILMEKLGKMVSLKEK